MKLHHIPTLLLIVPALAACPAVQTDTTPPTVNLGASSLAVSAAGSVTLTANATDDSGVIRVEFYRGTQKLSEDTASPYTQSVSFTAADNGEQTFTAKAFDTMDNAASSDPIKVTVDIDVTSPTVSLSSSATTLTAPGPVTLTADTSDNKGVAKVEFFEDATKLGEKTASPFTWELNLAAAQNGTHTYTAKATDASGNTTSSEAVNVLVDIDVTAPNVSLESSSAGVTTASSVTLTANATDNKGVAKVEFYKGNMKLGEKTSSPWTWTANLTDADNGTVAFSAKAFDADGNNATSNTANVTVDIDATAPTVSLESSNTNVTNVGTITLTATASDNKSIARVEFYDGSSYVGQDTISPYTLMIGFQPEGNGAHTYTAKAIDTSNNSATSTSVTVNVNIVTFAQLALGNWHTCGLTSGGKAYCWGGNSNGQLGIGSRTAANSASAVTMPTGVAFSQIAGGDSHTCALTPSGAAYCWGTNSDGRLGLGYTSGSLTTPNAVSMPSGVTFNQITAGETQACALGSDGKVYCWGGNGGEGRLGVSTATTRNLSPTAITLPTGVTAWTALSSGTGRHTCARASSGDWYCWGSGGSGELGNGSSSSTTDGVPVKVNAPTGVSLTNVSVRYDTSTGSGTTCAMGLDGQAYCWGALTGTNSPTAMSTSGLPVGVSFSSLWAGGMFFACGLGSDGKVYCKGNNDYSQLGNGTTTANSSSFGTTTMNTVTFTGLVAGNRHVCALMSFNSTAYCWGLGTSGQLGNGASNTSSTPVRVVTP